ncbi:hypothetical protein [Streptomyces sp. I05A-00742]|uniref:hypothetical protein n=1 Tax=Streptomyces sp. I05A-00742 TaxID=2732853 RepID=UPI001BB23B41|nr:hypothetical protein [Streptomyces sp. I05A-00742]
MTSTHEEIAEQQAVITRLLLHHIHAPLTGDQHIRGVLPVLPPAGAIRVVSGGEGVCAADELLAYELPLRTHDSALTVYDVIGILRTLLTGTHIYPSDRVGTVMGMKLLQVDPASVKPAAETPDDTALRVLRTLAGPLAEEQPGTRLRGFLFTGRDRLRLYLDTEEAPGAVIAADVRLTGAVTALIAAVPSLIGEEERRTTDAADPHCSWAMDLTHW